MGEDPVHPRRWLDPLLAALVSTALAVGITWPRVLHPVSLVVGHPGNDNWNHIWGYWWVGEALSDGYWPGYTRLLSFPRGGTLYFIDTIQAVASWPIQLLFGPAAAYNLVVVAGFALSGLAAWLLARRVTGDSVAAGAALIIYEASPHVLGQAYNGISETVCAGWLPLTLWCLLRLLDRSTWSRSLALRLTAAACMLTSWYYGLFAALAGGALVVWYMARQPYVVWWRRALPRVLASAVVAGVLIAPPLGAFQASLEATDALVTRDPDFVQSSLLNHNITDIVAFFHATRTRSPVTGRTSSGSSGSMPFTEGEPPVPEPVDSQAASSGGIRRRASSRLGDRMAEPRKVR